MEKFIQKYLEEINNNSHKNDLLFVSRIQRSKFLYITKDGNMRCNDYDTVLRYECDVYVSPFSFELVMPLSEQITFIENHDENILLKNNKKWRFLSELEGRIPLNPTRYDLLKSKWIIDPKDCFDNLLKPSNE